jgi:hypothetical protein
MNDAISIKLDQLRGMIGVQVEHNGHACEVVEVLEDGPSVVLRCLDQNNIQTSQHGNPTRRTPQIFTIPVLTPDHREIHAEFLALELL